MSEDVKTEEKAGCRPQYRARLLPAFLFFSLALALALLSPNAALAKYASIIIDDDTGAVLHQANADTRNHPASLTKMMTLYLTFEALERGQMKLETPLKVSKRASGQAPSKLGLKKGQTITVKQAILALVTKSANDVATVLAEAIGGTEMKFARMMTGKARELGMTKTTFRNASGLYNRRQLSTARDLAILARAMPRRFPTYYHYFRTKSFSYKGRTYKNHNNLLKSYRGADGIKTGYINASGFNLAASAARNGRRLVGVVMGGRSARSRNAHMSTLLDKGFRKIKFGGLRADAGDKNKNGAIFIRKKALAPPARNEVLAKNKPAHKKTQKAGRRVASVANPTGEWGIQVGAYSRFATAHLAATRTARALPTMLTHTKVAIDPIRESKSTLYRARLFGLSEKLARSACARLKKKKLGCLAVPPGKGVSMAFDQGDGGPNEVDDSEATRAAANITSRLPGIGAEITKPTAPARPSR